jgi:hypothetical protein
MPISMVSMVDINRTLFDQIVIPDQPRFLQRSASFRLGSDDVEVGGDIVINTNTLRVNGVGMYSTCVDMFGHLK